MTRWNRILLDVKRRTLRSSFAITLVLYTLFASLFLFLDLQGGGGGLEMYRDLTFFILPLFACPLVAGWTTRDADSGLGEILETTPLQRGEHLASSFLSLGLLLTAGQLVVLPLTFVTTTSAAPGAFLAFLPFHVWAFALGLSAGAAGFFVGSVTGSRRRLALSISFLLVVFWIPLGLGRGDLLGLAEPGASEFVRFLQGLSPLSWPYLAVVDSKLRLRSGGAWFIMGPVLLCAGWLALRALVGSSLGVSAGGHRSRRRVLAGGVLLLVAGSLGAVGSLATWDQASDRSDFVTESVHGDLYVSTSTSYGPGLDAEFFPSPTLEIKFMGPRNASVVLSQVEMTSQAGTFTLAIDLPYRVELDRAVVDHDGVFAEGERFGYQTVEVPFKYAPHLHETWIRTNIHLVVDGVEIEQHSFLIRKHPGLPMGAAVLAVIVPTIFLAVARIQLPRRLNRW